MTVLVAVRTSTAVVFAADSKLTTQGFIGFDTNGDPQFVPQTYDNAIKIGHDAAKTLIAAVTGNSTLGEYRRIGFLVASHHQTYARQCYTRRVRRNPDLADG